LAGPPAAPESAATWRAASPRRRCASASRFSTEASSPCANAGAAAAARAVAARIDFNQAFIVPSGNSVAADHVRIADLDQRMQDADALAPELLRALRRIRLERHAAQA